MGQIDTLPTSGENADVLSRQNEKDLTGRARSMANLCPPWTAETRPHGGRPKKITDALDKALTAEVTTEVANAIIKQAKKGNVFAFDKIAERIEGKVAQKLEMSGSVLHGVDDNQLESRLESLLAKRSEPKELPAIVESSDDGTNTR